MKKYNLLKVLAITVAVVWIMTLFIPGSYLDYSGTIASNGISSVGIVGLLSNLSISISYFNGIAILIVAVACFYAVLNKLEVYNKFVSNVASKFKNKERILVTISIIVFGVLACLVSDYVILIIFMPFVYQVMKALDIDKKVILSSTIVATIIGAMCGIYNSTLFNLLQITVNTLLLVKVIILVLSLAVLTFFVAPKNVKTVKNESKNTQTKKSTSSKKSTSGRRKA